VPAETNQFGIAPHTDANFLTFLAQTEVPGLQVRLPSGGWFDVPYIPGSFAVNAGDMLYRWTNGRFKSTPHRALPPVGQHRHSIPHGTPHRYGHRLPANMSGSRQPTALSVHYLRRVSAVVV